MGVIRLSTIPVVGMLVLGSTSDAGAQYFGRNKVEYVDFDFRILRTEHFDVYHYRREERAARIAAQLAERWYARFARMLHHELEGRQPLVLYASQPEFAQTNVVSTLLPDTVGGVTESARRRIAMPFAPTLSETNHVLGHEIAHAFQFDIARRHGSGQPLWFIEGMAEYLARGAVDAQSSLWLRDAGLHELLPPRQRDAARTLSPYQFGHAFWSYLAERFGNDVVEKSLKPPTGGKFNDRMRQATGIDLDQLYSDWRASVYATYGSQSESSGRDAGSGHFQKGGSGRVQLGPALSPDGRRAVFFSERDRFSLDLFLADVSTGRIVRKLATTTASARFDSLQPLRSVGAWSPSGASFVFPAVRQGHAALVVYDMRHARRDREVQFAGLGQILSISWSPDGGRLVFSALAGGFTNLYLYDLAGGTLRSLTDDAYADLHPAWSPDGREIAFVTDRYSTDLASLQFGRTELALIDPASGGFRPVRGARAVRSAAHINPQWSADGNEIFFIADPGGVSNVFRVDLTSAVARQLTDVSTGVAGLTATSPALSVASQAPVMAFTVYGNRKYELVVREGASALAGHAVEPLTPTTSLVAHDGLPEGLFDSSSESSDPATMEVRAYSPRMKLERIGQPYVSSGGGAFGTFVRVGGSMMFGDLLGERLLGTAVQIGNRMRDAAFEARFINREHRLNWGAIADLEPALRRYRYSRVIEHEGQPALVKEADYLQRVQLRVAGLLAYPLNRGLRLEFTGGVRHAAYYRDVRSQVSSVSDGRVLEEARVQSTGGIATTVGQVSAALVGDTTVFGPTGPLLGSRYRFEVAPAAGDLLFTSVLADYRRYVMPVKPYTMAVRVLHSGRYGRDGNDPRLLPSFLGSRYFVRGHMSDERYCQPDPVNPCGGELVGDRLLVGNVELRVPVWGMLSRRLEYGPLPMDAFVFADAGVVWSGGRGERIAVMRRNTISSIGAGARMNAGGLPFEIAVVRALDGPLPGWSFDFGFRTGF
jgi:hypothetical protein